jgi:hypothetical protein
MPKKPDLSMSHRQPPASNRKPSLYVIHKNIRSRHLTFLIPFSSPGRKRPPLPDLRARPIQAVSSSC